MFDDFVNNELDSDDLEKTPEQRLTEAADVIDDNFGLIDLKPYHEDAEARDKLIMDIVLFLAGNTSCHFCGTPLTLFARDSIWGGDNGAVCGWCFYEHMAGDEWREDHPQYKDAKA